MDCAVYRDGIRQAGSTNWSDALDDITAAGTGFLWLGLHEPTAHQLAGIAERFGLHPLAVEDAVHAHQRPKLDRYDGMLFAVVKTVHYDETRDPGEAEVVETGEVMAFVGSNYVITVRHGDHGGLRDLRHLLEAEPGHLAYGPSVVLHAIADRAVDGYLRVADALQADIDQIETSVFQNASRFADTNRMYALKREVLSLRRAATPLSAPMNLLADKPMPLVAEEIRSYFRDVDDHLVQVVEQVTAFDDLLNNLVAANLAQVSVVQNEDMRKISAWAAIALVPTMFAGIYGMNFDDMPELHWRFGYPLLIGVIIASCYTLYRAFRHNGWL